MRMHDIICDADGWAHYLDGVKQKTFPTWFMAMTAARKAAERDIKRGVAAAFRYQGADGEMRPVQAQTAMQGTATDNAGQRVPPREPTGDDARLRA